MALQIGFGQGLAKPGRRWPSQQQEAMVRHTVPAIRVRRSPMDTVRGVGQFGGAHAADQASAFRRAMHISVIAAAGEFTSMPDNNCAARTCHLARPICPSNTSAPPRLLWK